MNNERIPHFGFQQNVHYERTLNSTWPYMNLLKTFYQQSNLLIHHFLGALGSLDEFVFKKQNMVQRLN